jgi:hypothetical protein
MHIHLTNRWPGILDSLLKSKTACSAPRMVKSLMQILLRWTSSLWCFRRASLKIWKLKVIKLIFHQPLRRCYRREQPLESKRKLLYNWIYWTRRITRWTTQTVPFCNLITKPLVCHSNNSRYNNSPNLWKILCLVIDWLILKRLEKVALKRNLSLPSTPSAHPSMKQKSTPSNYSCTLCWRREQLRRSFMMISSRLS